MKKRVIPLLGALGLLSAGLMTERHTPQDEPSPRSPTLTERTFTQQSLAGLSSPDLGPILSASSARTPAGAQQAYVDGQLMVLPSDTANLDDIARDHGASVVREAGPSGYGVLEAPAGLDALAFARTLRADERILSSSRHGLLLGAGKGKAKATDTTATTDTAAWDDKSTTDTSGSSSSSTSSGSGSGLQWHLDSAGVPSNATDTTGRIVAILDSGVSAVPSLVDSERVAEWDFVNDDADARDDHQHGTHIASIIASSSESVQGVAPGVSLMPLKVLNHENQGYEIDLVDAIYWAVDNRADVINMSLAFGEDYVPSAALAQALRHGTRAGVVMIAASGNAGVDQVSWPAASPDVIAVGANCADGVVAEYSNVGGAMDIMAPGGCIDQDVNGDGIPDGVIAESIGLQDPSSVGLWAMAGTSQAAAVAAGAAVRALAAGGLPVDMAELLQYTASKSGDYNDFVKGHGAGDLVIDAMVGEPTQAEGFGASNYNVAMLPYLVDNGDGTVTPTAQLTVVDDTMRTTDGITVMAQFHGATSETAACEVLKAASEGQCVIRGLTTPAFKDGERQPLAWRITIDAVVKSDVLAFRPNVLMFGSEELDDIAAAQNADPELREAMLALYWAEGDEPDLGPLAESYAVVNSGSGLSTSPIGMLFTAPALQSVSSGDLSLDGTGLSTSPIGMRWMMLDGSGFSTSPITLLALTAFEGSGLSTSPIGMMSYSMLGGSGLSTSPILMSSGTIDGDGSLGSLQTLVSDGGWASIEGEQAASVLAGSGEFATLADAVGTGAGTGAVEVSLD